MCAPHQAISRQTSGSASGRIGSAYGRDVESRVAAAHLVMVDIRLRHPVAIHEPGEMLRLGQVEREAITVVVVPGILLVQPRQPGRLVRRPDILHVPVGDHLRPVRIDRRRDDADDAVQHPLRFLVGPADAVVDELGGGLRRRNLARMQRKGLDDDGTTFGHELPRLALGEPARIRETRVDLLVTDPASRGWPATK